MSWMIFGADDEASAKIPRHKNGTKRQKKPAEIHRVFSPLRCSKLRMFRGFHNLCLPDPYYSGDAGFVGCSLEKLYADMRRLERIRVQTHNQ